MFNPLQTFEMAQLNFGDAASILQSMMSRQDATAMTIFPLLISPLAGFQASWPNVTLFQGTEIDTTDTSNFTAALAGAAEADFVIYCGGIDVTIEAEGLNRTNIMWPGNQFDLINELAALKKLWLWYNLVVVNSTIVPC